MRYLTLGVSPYFFALKGYVEMDLDKASKEALQELNELFDLFYHYEYE